MNCLIWSHFQVIYVALPNLKMALESTEVKYEYHILKTGDEDE